MRVFVGPDGKCLACVYFSFWEMRRVDDLRHSKTLTLLLLTVTENALSFNNTLKGGGGAF